MNAAHVGPDWQTWITLAIGLLALAYLVRRWWPRKGGAHPAHGGAHCGTGTPGVPTASSSASGGCQSCSGGCGTGPVSPWRDHRANAAGHAAGQAHTSPAAQAVHWHPPRQAKH